MLSSKSSSLSCSTLMTLPDGVCKKWWPNDITLVVPSCSMISSSSTSSVAPTIYTRIKFVYITILSNNERLEHNNTYHFFHGTTDQRIWQINARRWTVLLRCSIGHLFASSRNCVVHGIVAFSPNHFGQYAATGVDEPITYL